MMKNDKVLGWKEGKKSAIYVCSNQQKVLFFKPLDIVTSILTYTALGNKQTSFLKAKIVFFNKKEQK